MFDIETEHLNIIYYPNPVLLKKCNPIVEFGAQLKEIAKKMIFLMNKHKGVGLAAPQVGLSIQLFVVSKLASNTEEDLIIVNPKLNNLKNFTLSKEGCLSMPQVQGEIKRANSCILTAQDVNGKEIELQGEDLISFIFQHETDHLNGISILDRMSPGDKIKNKKHLDILRNKWITKVNQ